MPRTKSLQHYPIRYSEIVRECSLEGKTTRVTLATNKLALSMRGHWYAFIGALKAEAYAADRRIREGKIIATQDERELIELARLAPTVMVQVEDHGPEFGATISFQSREHSWQAKALRGGVTVVTDAKPTAAGFDEAQQRLMEIQKEIDNDTGK